MNSYQREILFALTRLGKPVYEGTISKAIVLKRRARNKVAKQSRKINR